jgi:hypothetical protein
MITLYKKKNSRPKNVMSNDEFEKKKLNETLKKKIRVNLG